MSTSAAGFKRPGGDPPEEPSSRLPFCPRCGSKSHPGECRPKCPGCGKRHAGACKAYCTICRGRVGHTWAHCPRRRRQQHQQQQGIFMNRPDFRGATFNFSSLFTPAQAVLPAAAAATPALGSAQVAPPALLLLPPPPPPPPPPTNWPVARRCAVPSLPFPLLSFLLLPTGPLSLNLYVAFPPTFGRRLRRGVRIRPHRK
ncbi:hypothetical protein PHISCL_07446 [Aspergillus sclerotialis]|uniref:Uncharacterized protein n=1 Tax=Aspergillus sclerotialis TaxID=2070753 RepID=A0A3A2ZFS8_9EURO|nr:hypothetical protein PHISCL_07446 [Aspergillus sclerotialis]